MSTSTPHSQGSSSQRPQERLVQVRRAPSLIAFGVTGVVVGLMVAAVLTFFVGGSDEHTRSSVFGVLAVCSMGVCTAIFLTIALMIDRFTARRAEVVRAVATDEE
ncbi:hypothetical protein ACN08Z_00390 [Rothia sp. P7181]|uniref:hypothetical protein n=1 Tax=unclassified Rothia (in: high G+C Gram-positive bacteria) TaxID=2689056 RepID=UPI003AD67E0E